MRSNTPLILLTLVASFIIPAMIGNLYASTCPPGSCSVQTSSNVAASDGTIWIQIDNGTYSANTGNYCQTNSCTVPLTQGSPPTLNFGYDTNHTLSVLNANTTFTGQTTQGHYVWKEWDNYYGTSFQTKWTARPNLNIGPIQYNYTGSAGFTAVFDKQYPVTLSFTDVNGSPLSPSPASLTLVPQTSGTPVTINNYSGQYVSANDYTIQSAVWEGATIGPATSNEFVNIANGPASSTIALEAYPATIHITDINNNPISGANVTVTFANGTSTSRLYITDSNGNVPLGDIPFPGSIGVLVRFQNRQFGPYSASFVGTPTVTIRLNVTITSPPSWAIGSVLTVSALTSTSLLLSWQAASSSVGVARYRVFQNGTLIGTVSSSITSFSVTGLTSGSSYYFRVEAIDAYGDVSISDLTQAETMPVPPSWPGGSVLTLSSVTSSSLTLSWPAASSKVGVEDYRITEGGVLIASVSGNTTSFLVTGLSPGKFYDFQVEAVDHDGNVSNTALSQAETMPVQSTIFEFWLFIALGVGLALGSGVLLLMLRSKHRVRPGNSFAPLSHK